MCCGLCRVDSRRGDFAPHIVIFSTGIAIGEIFFVEEIVDGDARCDAANGRQMETIVGIQMCQKIAWQHEIRVVVVGHVLSTDKLVEHHRLKSSMCKSNDLVGQHIGREA